MTQSVYRSFTQRLLLLMLMMVMSIGNVWGDPVYIDKYYVKGNSSQVCSINDMLSQLSTTVEDMKDAYYIKWYVLYDDVKQDLNGGSASGSSYGFKAQNGFWPYVYDSSRKQVYIYNIHITTIP